MSDVDIQGLLRTAVRSITGVDRGEYCNCAEPESLGMVCAKCERRIKSEEIRKIVEIVGCHEHVPGALEGHMCKVCTMYPETPRHNGIAAIGRTSWGAEVVALRVDAPNDDVTCWRTTT